MADDAAGRCYTRKDMLDLKAKLASAGLVTPEDIERVEKSKNKRKNKSKGSKGVARKQGTDSVGLSVSKLMGKPKAEVYEAVRRWVDKVRLDRAGSIPSETAQTFHFAEASGKVGRLYLEPAVIDSLRKGEAGVIAYMSNHGLAHAVVPSAGAAAIGELNQMWLRMLEGDARAGQIERPTPAASEG